MSQSSVSVYAYYAREKKNFSFFPLRPNTYMEITRIKEDVGYRPQYDIKRGRRVHRLAEEPSRIIAQQPFLQSVKSYRCRGQVFYMRDSEALIQETTRPYAHARQELVNSRLDPSCSPPKNGLSICAGCCFNALLARHLRLSTAHPRGNSFIVSRSASKTCNVRLRINRSRRLIIESQIPPRIIYVVLDLLRVIRCLVVTCPIGCSLL
jgi:hypothetical protein